MSFSPSVAHMAVDVEASRKRIRPSDSVSLQHLVSFQFAFGGEKYSYSGHPLISFWCKEFAITATSYKLQCSLLSSPTRNLILQWEEMDYRTYSYLMSCVRLKRHGTSSSSHLHWKLNRQMTRCIFPLSHAKNCLETSRNATMYCNDICM